MPTSKVDIRARQAPIRQRYLDDPDGAPVVLRVRGGSSDLADPLHCVVSPQSVPAAVFRAGAHPAVGGDGDVPCSGAHAFQGVKAPRRSPTVSMPIGFS